MRNDTPPHLPTGEERVREQARAALQERGWELVSPSHFWEMELAVGHSADGEYEASLWDSPGYERDAPWRCDVGLTASGAEKQSLWLLGIPWPENVPDLLERHADILSVGHGGRTLDLATGKVIVGESGIVASMRDAKNRLGGYEEAARALFPLNWIVREVRLGVGDGPDKIVAERKSAS